MNDITEQLQAWSKSLADTAAPADIASVGSGAAIGTGHTSGGVPLRRWIAIAASIALLTGGVFVAARLGGDGAERVGPAISASPTVVPATPASTGPSATDTASQLAALDHVVIVDGEPVGDTWVTGLATNDVELAALWARIEMPVTPPKIDFAQDVVVYFGPAESGSCRFAPLGGVSYDPVARRVFPVLEFSDVASAGGSTTCTGDANPHAIVVSIARDDLPDGDFEFWVDDQDPPACCITNVTRANGDLLRTSAPITTTTVAIPPTIAAVGIACRGDLDATTAFASFVADMVTARTTGDFSPVADCLSGVPGVFDGQPPGCWTACDDAPISFAFDPDRIFAGGDVTGAAWFHSLPVSHEIDGAFVDVIESWPLRTTPDGWVVDDPTITAPFIERTAALEVINRYLAAVDRGDWATVASLLDDGGRSLEERLDLQELSPTTYTQADIARSLAAWCAAGCDTTRPTAADLRFDGSYALERRGRTISAVWFEGVYSISGLPFPTTP